MHVFRYFFIFAPHRNQVETIKLAHRLRYFRWSSSCWINNLFFVRFWHNCFAFNNIHVVQICRGWNVGFKIMFNEHSGFGLFFSSSFSSKSSKPESRLSVRTHNKNYTFDGSAHFFFFACFGQTEIVRMHSYGSNKNWAKSNPLVSFWMIRGNGLELKRCCQSQLMNKQTEKCSIWVRRDTENKKGCENSTPPFYLPSAWNTVVEIENPLKVFQVNATPLHEFGIEKSPNIRHFKQNSFVCRAPLNNVYWKLNNNVNWKLCWKRCIKNSNKKKGELCQSFYLKWPVTSDVILFDMENIALLLLSNLFVAHNITWRKGEDAYDWGS